MFKAHWVWVVVVALPGLSGCTLAKSEDPIVVSQVKEEFEITMWEELSPNGRTFQLLVETLDITPCENTLIATNSSLRSKFLKLSLLDIAQPEDCNPGTNPARTTASYGKLNPGYYYVSIDLKETVNNEGNLIVTADRYELNMGSTQGLEIPNKVLQRVPEGTLWGYYAYENEEDAGAAEEMYAELSDYVEEYEYADGDYGYFDIEDNAVELNLSEEPDEAFHQPFILHFSGGDTEAFRDALDQVRKEAPEGSRLEVQTWMGTSW